MRSRTIRLALVAVAFMGVAGVASALTVTQATVTERADRVAVPSRSFSVVATGDWLPEALVNRAAERLALPSDRIDNARLLDPIAAIVASADLAICHIETPIGEPGGQYGFVGRASNGFSLLASPYELAGDLRRVGYDRCSTASNHSNDQGASGVASTLAALDAAGLGHTGTARSAAEANVEIIDVNQIRVGHLSFTVTSNTGFPGEPWRINRASVAAIADAAASARSAGAEIVLLSLHVFNEMGTGPAAEDRALVDQIVHATDLDLVIMHGPHVVQPLEYLAGTPVYWSLGNLVSGMGVGGRGRYSDPRTLDGLLAAVRFTDVGDGTFVVEPETVLLCQMTDTRVVYAGISARFNPSTPAAAIAGIDACVARSQLVVSGLR